MAYFTIPLIKKNIEIQPSDDSLDGTLALYGAEGDVFVDSIMGNGTALTANIPEAFKQASSIYAAGRYLRRVNADPKGDILIADAKNLLVEYKKGSGFVVVFG